MWIRFVYLPKMAFLIATNDFFQDPHLPFLDEHPFCNWKCEYIIPINAQQFPTKSPRNAIVDRLNTNQIPEESPFYPESIVNIRSTHKRTREGQLSKKGLTFKVHWRGYPSETDTWEPYQHLKDNLIFHQYCRDHDLEYLIPLYYRIPIHTINH